MMSDTGISLISYCGPRSFGSRRCRREKERVCENGLDSSVAKLCMCERLFTFIRRGDADVESKGDRSDPIGDSWAEEDVEGMDLGFDSVFGVALVAVGVGCCECGRKRGLGGGGCTDW